MDLSTLSDADLKAVAAGDMSKVSDDGLQIISGGKPKPKAGVFESAGAGLAGGLANMGLGAAAAAADYTGFKDTAANLDSKRKSVEAWQQQHGGDTTTGKVSSIVGSLIPALAMPEAGIPALLANGTLFALPGFRDSYNAQIADGASPTVAAAHGLANAGFAMFGGRIINTAGKTLPEALQAGKGVGSQIGHALGEGAAFETASQVTDKGIDTVAGRKNDNAWIDPKKVAENAAAFGVLRGAHMAVNAPANARAAAADKAAADLKAQQDYETQQKAEANAQAAKQTPQYLQQLDGQYRTMLQEQQAARAALGPKPKDKTDPSAIDSWNARNKEIVDQFNSDENKALIAEHAARRPEIEAVRAQAQQQADAAAQQAALAPNADQTDTRAPIDNGPPAANAQPDLFAEGQTAPSGAGAPAVETAPSIDQQLQQANEALRQNNVQIDTLRGTIEEAHKKGDLQTVVTQSKAANQLAAQTKPLEDAVAKLQAQHTPTVKGNIDKIKKQLDIAVANGDTAQIEKLATKITELQKQVQANPQQTVDAAPAQNAKIDSELANQMADGREQAAATSGKVADETSALQKMGDTGGGEAQGILASQAKDAQARLRNRAKLGLPTPTLQEQTKAKEKNQPNVHEEDPVETYADKIADNVTNPDVAETELKIRNLKLEQVQQKSIGREDLAAETQTKIAALESKIRVNTDAADTVGHVDSLFAQREKLRDQGDRAKAAGNVQGVEDAAKQMNALSDQLAQAQKEPGSVVGRLVKAKNDTQGYLTAIFDAAHEMHTTGTGLYLREKQQALHKLLARMDEKGVDSARIGEDQMHTHRSEVVRQLEMLDRQLGRTNNETPIAQLAMHARQASQRYIRATFREENIRREARNQPPLTGKERADFAKKTMAHTEALIQRAGAERRGDYMEEHIVQPAQMRSGQVVKGPVTEMRDARPLEERPFGRFGAARAVEEEGFHETKAGLSQTPAKSRVEGTGVKRQWNGVQRPEDAQRTMPKTSTADQAANNERLLEGTKGPAGDKARETLESADNNGEQTRRAHYLMNRLTALEGAGINANSFSLRPMRDALEEFPTPAIMDIIEPMLHEAETGRLPEGGERSQGSQLEKMFGWDRKVGMESPDMLRLKEAVALERKAADNADGNKGQRGLFDPQTTLSEQRGIEDKQAALETRHQEIEDEIAKLNGAKYGNLEAAAKALKQVEALRKEQESLPDQHEALEEQRQKAKADESALKEEAGRMSTAHERTTPARFANSPEVKTGRAAADEAAKQADDISKQLEGYLAEDAKPTWYQTLTAKLREVKDRIDNFVESRSFAGADFITQLMPHKPAEHTPQDDAGRKAQAETEAYRDAVKNNPAVIAADKAVDEKRNTLDTLQATKTPDTTGQRSLRTRRINAARKELDTAIAARNEAANAVKPPKASKRAISKIFTPADAEAIRDQIASYNKIAEDMNAFLVEQKGKETPEFVKLRDELDQIKSALKHLPKDPAYVKVERAAKDAKATLEAAEKTETPPAKLTKLRAAYDAAEGARLAYEKNQDPGIPAAERRVQEASDKIAAHNADVKKWTEGGKWMPREEQLIQGRLLAREKSDADAALAKLKAPKVNEDAAKQRVATAIEIAKRNADIDAAVEERMQHNETVQRLAKLPAIAVTRNQGVTDAIRVGLNREAAGIRARLELINDMRADPNFFTNYEAAIKKAVADGKKATVVAKMKNRLADAKTLDMTDAGIKKWERLLENAERNLQQLEDVAPRQIKERGEPTSEKDDVIPSAPLDAGVAAATKIDVDKAPLKFETEADGNVSTKERQPRRDAGELTPEEHAQLLNAKQVVGGRGTVTRKIGAGQGKTSIDRKRPTVTANAAIETGVRASAEKRAKEIDEKLADIARLRELNDEKMQEAVENENEAAIEKYTAFNNRFDKAVAKLKAEYVPLEKIINKGVKRGSKLADTEAKAVDVSEGDAADVAEMQMGDVETKPTIEDSNEAANRPSADSEHTPLSDTAVEAVKDNRLTDALHDIARTATDPEARDAAAKLAPFVKDTSIGVKDDVQVNGEAADARYVPRENSIDVHSEGLTEQNVLHEAAHAATDGVMLADPKTLTNEQRKARMGLEGMWNSTKGNAALAGEHATTSAREFVAEVFTNPQFRAKLDSIGKPLSMLERFKNFIRQMFGFPTSPSGKARDMVEKILSKSAKREGAVAANRAYATELGRMGRGMSQNRSVVDDVKEAGPRKLALAAEQKLVDFRASLRLISKIGDKATGTQVRGDILSADRQMLNGAAAASDGAFKLTKDAKGLYMMGAGGGTNAKQVLEAIGKIPGKMSADEKMDMFQAYMSGKRADDVGWHKMNHDDPVGMENTYRAAVAKLDPATKAALEKAQDVYHEMNKGLVRFLDETDAIPKDLVAKMMADRNYIPFFRNSGDTLDMVMQDGTMRSVGDVRTLPFLHALSGGNEKIMPFEQSLLKNITMLTNLGVANMTNRHIADHLQGIGASATTVNKPMQIRPGKGPASDKVIRFRVKPDPKRPTDDGERHIVIDTKGTAAEHIPSDLLAQAVAGSYTAVPSLLKVGAWASDLLRAGVTRMPTYLVSQMVKDPMNASMMGNLKANPVAATLKSMNNFQEYLRGNTPEGELMARHGILHSNIWTGSKDDMAKIAMQLAGSNQGKYRQFMTKLDKVAMGADAATRIQAYRDVVKSGGSELEAMIHAQEMQNFSKHGSSASLQMISRLTPFFNAQIQGLNVLAKSAQGKMPAAELMNSKNAFMKRALGMTALALVAAAQLDEDPEWNKLTMGSQMGHIPIPGTDFTIPPPFESGMMFWSLPIAFMHALKQDFSDNDWQEVRDVIKNQMPGNGSIVPQLAKGYLDVSRNYNSHFSTPIETPGMEKKDVTERYTASTPELIKAFSRHLKDIGVKLSPVQIDYLANAYLGQFPHMVAAATNHIFETKSNRKDMGEAASGSNHDNPLLARFTTNPAESRHVNDAYDLAKQAGLTAATVKSMIKDGRADEAREYQKDQFKKYGTPQQATAFTNQMGFFRRQVDSINENANLSGDQKQQKLEDLYKRRDAAAKNWLAMIEKRGQ